MMAKAFVAAGKGYRLVIISALVAGAFALTYYCHVTLGIGTVFAHLFYIPIILASLWWQRKGMIVALLLAVGLIASHLLLRVHVETVNDYLRAVMFIGVSFAAAALSERIAEEKKLLLESQERLRRLASELSLAEERQRRQLSAALHDGIDQNLYAMKAKVTVLGGHDSPEMRKKMFDEILRLLDQTMADVRGLTFELCPPVLYNAGLEAAIEWLAGESQRRHDFLCTFVDDGQVKPLDNDIRSMVFHAVRELLINAAKHAQPDTVKVSLARDGGNLKAVVEDDGLGFDASAWGMADARNSGFGLFGICQCLAAVGGWSTINSEPGKGTHVEIIVPLSDSGGAI